MPSTPRPSGTGREGRTAPPRPDRPVRSSRVAVPKGVLAYIDLLLRSATMRSDKGNLTSRLVAAGSVVLLGLAGAGIAADPAAASGHHPAPGSAGLGDRLYPLLGNGGYDVQNYDLSVFYPKKDPAQQVHGTVTITAVATQSLSRF